MQRFEELAAFKAPTEKRFEPCIRLMKLRKSGRAQSDEAKSIMDALQEHEPGLFQLVKTALNVDRVVGNQSDVRLPISNFQKFNLCN